MGWLFVYRRLSVRPIGRDRRVSRLRPAPSFDWRPPGRLKPGATAITTALRRLAQQCRRRLLIAPAVRQDGGCRRRGYLSAGLSCSAIASIAHIGAVGGLPRVAPRRRRCIVLGSAAMGKTVWRGVTLDTRTAAMMDEAQRLLGGAPYLKPTQGSYSTSVGQSAGTHAGTSAIDLSVAGMDAATRARVRDTLRRVGMAAWVRSPSQGNWPWHIHAIAMAEPFNRHGASGAAQDQMRAYRNGRDGLRAGRPDDGARDYVHVVWESYERPETATERRPRMILVQRKKDGRVFLCGVAGLAYIHNPDDLREISAALADPTRIAKIGDGTYSRLAAHTPAGAVPK